ncbi:unnamed protein product [Lactuca saligna]|uniref:Uncharacterized protein n=1 Tax=Lactuca saligna TaxID=75948 RepID=A0AA35VDI6_LACSI|nr:unnamed protein product [Lactuca saligna]
MMGHLSVKASRHKLHEVLGRLNGPVRDLFSTTNFGYLLDLPAQSGDVLLIRGLLLHMLHPTAKTDVAERLYFRFSRRTLSFGLEEFCLVARFYMGWCPTSRIKFSTMYKHGYGVNTFRSRVFPYRTDTSLVVEDLELIILNQRFNDISAHDGVRAILLYILNQADIFVSYILWKQPIFQVYRGNSYGGTRDGDDLEDFFNKAFEGNDNVGGSLQKLNRKKKKKKVVASEIVDAENQIPGHPVVKQGRPVSQLKHSQHLSPPYVSVQNALRYRTGCNAPALYMGNKPAVFLKHQLYNEKMEAKFWDLLFYASELGFLDEAWAGSATGNPFDPLDGCKSWLEVDSLWMDTHTLNLYNNFRSFGTVKIIDFVWFAELMEHILLEICYWNHMGLPVQKASIIVTDVTDVPQQEGMFGEYGVFMLIFMEQLVSGRPIGISMAPVVGATQFRYIMAMIYYGSSKHAIFS